uniref:TIR domain-containing protein n=1 Tax=Neogobius melanostomus TaxID=47308 RepID=A0A8C6UCH5_9GOBI
MLLSTGAALIMTPLNTSLFSLLFLLLQIPSDIPESTSDFRDFPRLQSLDLSHNQITHIEDAAFSHLLALNELNLDGNRLKDLTDTMFEGLTNLTVLDLRNNKIKSISEFVFGPLRKLHTLYLLSNRLSRISDIVNVVISCPHLPILYLGSNNFSSFESEPFPFPLNVSELDLSANPLHRFMLHSDLFPRLKTLSLSNIYSQFQWDVSNKTFLKTLKTLDLSWTNFTTETYESVFKSVGSVENLSLRHVGRLLDRPLLDLACGIPSLHKLDLIMNSIPILNDHLLQSCTNLTDLDLSSNSITNPTESSLRMLTRLSKLDMSRNDLSQVPLTIRNMSSLTTLRLAYNHISKLHCLDFASLWQLTNLSLNNNNLVELNSCVFQYLHRLKLLDLDDNFIFQFDDSFSTMLPNLLILSANIARLQKGVFKNMSHLQDLNLKSARGTLVKEGRRSHIQHATNLPSLQILVIYVPLEICLLDTQHLLRGFVTLKEFSSVHLFCKSPHKDMFRDTPLLQDLSIYQNDNLCLDPEVFQPISHLKFLDLSANHMKSLDFLSQANLTELQKLVLRDNDLIVINETVFEALPSLKYIDLSENPFVCNCSNVGFIQWVLTNKQVYVYDAFSYRCASPPSDEGNLLLDFHVQACLDFPGFICFIFSSVLVLVTLLSTFTYHFLRWQLVYGFYLFRAFVYDRKKARQGCAEVYDAFVSYNVHDEDWVYKELVPELEDRQGWKLCLHHRDFEPGKAIMENIIDAIYSSRKTLCVISRHYLQSEWCSREIQMASFRLLDEQKDVLILLFLEELSAHDLSPFYRVRKLLRSRTYLSWSGARSHRGLFWERVRCALQCGAEISADNPLPDDV